MSDRSGLLPMLRATSAVLFGSVTRGDERPDIDLDVLLLTERESAIDPLLHGLGSGGERIQNRFGCDLRQPSLSLRLGGAGGGARPRCPEAVRDHVALVGPAYADLLGG